MKEKKTSKPQDYKVQSRKNLKTSFIPTSSFSDEKHFGPKVTWIHFKILNTVVFFVYFLLVLC